MDYILSRINNDVAICDEESYEYILSLRKRIEYILFVPALIGLFAYYFWMAFQEDSAVQKPEKLYSEKCLMLYCVFLILWMIALTLIDIPALAFLTSGELIRIG